MSLKQDLHSVWTALRQLSPVVVHVPPGIRHVLLQRYMEMSMQNGRLSLLSFGILLFGLAYEAPLLPRLLAWALLAAIYGVRVWRARRLARDLDPADPRSDHLYDVLLVVASSVWGVAPLLLQPWVTPFNLFCAMYAAFVATALLAITYIAALPAKTPISESRSRRLMTSLCIDFCLDQAEPERLQGKLGSLALSRKCVHASSMSHAYLMRSERRVPLHRKLGLQACDITVDRGDREELSLALVAQEAIAP